ncbi:MAG: hypothetical protein U5J78_02080 [Parasphingorhabdus sp.]|nr:hypothetical protein [Parasphingorhabdus sp.]
MVRPLILFVTAIILASCAGPIEQRIVSSGSGATGSGSYILADSGKNSSSSAQTAYAAVEKSLAERGWTKAPDSDESAAHILTVAVSDRPADIALTQQSANRSVTVSAAKQHKPLQRCTDREYRLQVRIERLSDGTQIYGGSASEYHCKTTLDEVLSVLAGAAVADLRSPRGAYIVERTGRE